ncbi:hypothetical protein J6590_026980 [Homalodisca vitripennis]|nr:hypothetical protein J6590_026980 [Homalodisca vitripennis]
MKGNGDKYGRTEGHLLNAQFLGPPPEAPPSIYNRRAAMTKPHDHNGPTTNLNIQMTTPFIPRAPYNCINKTTIRTDSKLPFININAGDKVLCVGHTAARLAYRVQIAIQTDGHTRKLVLFYDILPFVSPGYAPITFYGSKVSHQLSCIPPLAHRSFASALLRSCLLSLPDFATQLISVVTGTCSRRYKVVKGFVRRVYLHRTGKKGPQEGHCSQNVQEVLERCRRHWRGGGALCHELLIHHRGNQSKPLDIRLNLESTSATSATDVFALRDNRRGNVHRYTVHGKWYMVPARCIHSFVYRCYLRLDNTSGDSNVANKPQEPAAAAVPLDGSDISIQRGIPFNTAKPGRLRLIKCCEKSAEFPYSDSRLDLINLRNDATYQGRVEGRTVNAGVGVLIGGRVGGAELSANLAESYWQEQTVWPDTGSVMMGRPFSQQEPAPEADPEGETAPVDTPLLPPPLAPAPAGGDTELAGCPDTNSCNKTLRETFGRDQGKRCKKTIRCQGNFLQILQAARCSVGSRGHSQGEGITQCTVAIAGNKLYNCVKSLTSASDSGKK